MAYGTALRSTAAGSALGAVLAGTLWLLAASLAVTLAVAVVWATAVGSLLYVFETYTRPDDPGPWGVVLSAPLLVNVVLSLSALPLAASAVAGLSVLAIGFTLLGYAAGMATVHRQQSPPQTPTDVSS